MQTPGDIDARIARLGDAWNALNAAAGMHLLRPHVSAALADGLQAAYEQWMRWREVTTPLRMLTASPGQVSEELAAREREYNHARQAVQAELPQAQLPPELDPTTLGLPLQAQGLLVLVLVLGGLYLWGRK